MKTRENGNLSLRLGHRALLGAAVASLALLSACGDKKPEGQVVAVIDGNEITQQELNGELGAAAGAEGQTPQLRNAALDQIVQRRLLAQVAQKDGIENSPDYILRKRKLEENLIIQMLGEKLAREVKQPSAAQIDQLMSENPQAFADRTLFAVEQIAFAKPERDDVLTALAPTKTMQEVVNVLNKFGVKFQRGTSTIDSSSLPKPVFDQFKRVGSAEPIIIPAGGTVAVAKIMQSKVVPVPPEAGRQVAANAYMKQQVEKTMKERLDALKKTAKIEYQSGFSPPQSTNAGIPAAGSAPAATTAPGN